ncbi:MAG: hypothetical protein SchgKO_04850 [Schleiferiaceae bacterium]
MSQGEIPASFLDEKRVEIINSTENQTIFNSSISEREAKLFAKKANFFTNEFLLSGNVMFGDTLSTYVNNVLENLLGPTNSEIKAYAYRSTAVNAFMTLDGTLFVSTGLLAQVQNESELAFVLAHEVIHYEENHILEGYKEDVELSRDSEINDIQKKERETKYSKEKELEADKLALKNYLKSSPYDMEEAIEVFDVLLYSYLPFDERPLDYNTILPNSISIPQSIIAEEKAITAFDDYDDSESSHPNIKKRKEQYLDIVTEISTGGDKKSFVQPKEAFDWIQRIARKEVIIKSIENDDFPRALYNSMIFMQDHPEDSVEMMENIAFCWHAMSGYADDEMLDSDVLGDYQDYLEGNLYSLYFMIDNMSSKDLAACATWFNYNQYLKDTTNVQLKTLYQIGIYELVFYHEVPLDDFKTEAYVPIKDTLSPEEVEALSKVEKIRYKKAIAGSSNDYMMYAFVDLLKDENFVEEYKEFEGLYSDAQDSESFESLKMARSKERDEENEDSFLGADNIIVLSPSLFTFNPLSTDLLDVDATYETRFKVNECFHDVLDATGIKYEIVTPSDFTTSNVDEYNEYCKLKWWVNERLNHVNAPVEMYNHKYGSELAEAYGTRYLFVTGILSVSIPGTLFGGKDQCFYSAYVFDLETGDAYIVDKRNIRIKLSRDYVKSILYDTVYQITTPPKS